MTSRKDLGGNGANNHRVSSKDTFINRLIASLLNEYDPAIPSGRYSHNAMTNQPLLPMDVFIKPSIKAIS